MATKKINLALQGGGAHGAYTWGVLDRLLEEEDVLIEGISGTSAGAMNAAMLVSGFASGKRDGAKKQMETFWRRISEADAFSPIQKSAIDSWLTGWNMDTSPAYHWYDFVSRTFSPYELNPMNINPMRGILDDMMDFETLHAHNKIQLFVAATHVESGQARVFSCKEITTEVLLASACIPFLFQAIEIDGGHYWDGGYMGNPAIWPLIYHCESDDVVLVQLNPIRNDQVPRTAGEIINRLNEITFNSSLIAEMRAIQFVSKLIAEGRLEQDRYKDVKMHLVYSPEAMHGLNASSKMNTDWNFFQHLKEIGRKDAEDWLRREWKYVGVKSTLDIREKFLVGPGKVFDTLTEKKSQKNKKK
jgi:NTE family protein